MNQHDDQELNETEHTNLTLCFDVGHQVFQAARVTNMERLLSISEVVIQHQKWYETHLQQQVSALPGFYRPSLGCKFRPRCRRLSLSLRLNNAGKTCFCETGCSNYTAATRGRSNTASRCLSILDSKPKGTELDAPDRTSQL